MRKPKSTLVRKQTRRSEDCEIELLNSWINAQKPDRGSNPLLLPPLPSDDPVGRFLDGSMASFSRFSGARIFSQLPLSRKTMKGLRQSKYFKMTKIQTASLPHALAGRDILLSAKKRSGRILSFVIPVLEKLFRERYAPERGVGSIIVCLSREQAFRTFEVLKSVARHHSFSFRLLIPGGSRAVVLENDINILVTTPAARILKPDGTLIFDCSQLQVFVLYDVGRMLDINEYESILDAIISQLPKQRQNLLFSTTERLSLDNLARLSLNDPPTQKKSAQEFARPILNDPEFILGAQY